VTRPSIFLSAGEASGDLYVSRVARALRARDEGLRLVGVVGPHGRAAGVEPWARSEDLAVMGFGEVVRHLPRLFRLARELEARAAAEGVDLFLPVDYPGFHVRLAGRLRRRGIPTLDFIPPKTWSWARWRLGRLRASVERCAVIFPFEVDHYRGAGIDAVFVGHPLVDAHADALASDPPERRGLLVAPGSRPQELTRLAPILAEGVRRLGDRADRAIDVRVSRASGVETEWLRPLLDVGARPVEGTLFDELRRSEAAVVCSGTATVEAALAETPHLIVYRTGGLSYRIARRLATVEHIGMANIVLGRRAFPELLQDALTPGAIADRLDALFLDPDESVRAQQRSDARELRRRLGEPGCFDRVAALALERLGTTANGTD